MIRDNNENKIDENDVIDDKDEDKVNDENDREAESTPDSVDLGTHRVISEKC